jgi:Mor family transcriptional regulator
MSSQNRGAELYEFLQEKIVSGITKRLGEELIETAAEVASEVCGELTGEWGGGSVYVPRGLLLMAARNKRICAEYNGKNLRELSRKYDLGEMRVRQILQAGLRAKRKQAAA